MLSPKEIFSLIILLCCTLAQSSPSDCNCSCEKTLLVEANKLNRDLRNITQEKISIPSNIRIKSLLPECKDHSRKDTRGLIYAFYTLFRQLNQTVPLAAELKSLPTNLRQQKECLDYWNVSSSQISITNKETEKETRGELLIKSIESYHCLMQRLLNETSADAAEGAR